MKKSLLPCLSLLLLLLWGCEDIYRPVLESGEALLVVDARIVHGGDYNIVRLNRTLDFNDYGQTYPTVDDAEVSLVDGFGHEIRLNGEGSGLYRLYRPLDASGRYKLKIKADGEVFESGYDRIPAMPSIDSIFMVPGEILVETGTDEAATQLEKKVGAWLYIDIDAKGKDNYYRFSGRKVCQYVYNILPPGSPFDVPVYGWFSVTPWETFNIAAPADYSLVEDVRNHPLVFLEREYNIYREDEKPVYFMGWIYICHQYAISEQSHDFYETLNKQLSAEGKLFDPLYPQARGNIKCTSDPEKVVLGNFELSQVREHRFFVISRGNDNYFVKRIPYFWEIPVKGEMVDKIPAWWEVSNRNYPDGEW